MDLNIEEDDVCNRTSYIEDIITLKPKDAYVYILYTNIFRVFKTLYFNFEGNRMIQGIGEKNKNHRDPDNLFNMGYQIAILFIFKLIMK